jgi:1-deoxy-D-xylulose-5-phosphate reductoisomerase
MTDKIAILGSTGSIGRQTLEVVQAHREQIEVVAIAGKDEVDLLARQIIEFSPKLVSVENNEIKEKLLQKIGSDVSTEIAVGEEGLYKVAVFSESTMLVVAIPGALTLLPTLAAIKLNKDIALATKEVLVTAGKIIMEEANKYNINIYPIDSEHSAILQCLSAENKNRIRKIILTASGGAFLRTPSKDLDKMTAKEALNHPTWKMGPKITIDSATLMNKGFEVLEAHYLFGIDLSKIEVLIHPQSIVHSMVEFVDGSIMAQLGAPDMRVPIQYALLKRNRLPNNFKKLDFSNGLSLNFEKPEKNKFPCLDFAYEAGRRGGTMGAVLNAANEEAVNEFLNNQIRYSEIAVKIRKTMDRHKKIASPTLNQIINADQWARKEVKSGLTA